MNWPGDERIKRSVKFLKRAYRYTSRFHLYLGNKESLAYLKDQKDFLITTDFSSKELYRLDKHDITYFDLYAFLEGLDLLRCILELKTIFPNITGGRLTQYIATTLNTEYFRKELESDVLKKYCKENNIELGYADPG